MSADIWATAIEPDEAVARIEAFSGDEQWVLGGHALPEPVGARVLEGAGRPVWGATVRFEPDAGSGRASPGVVLSDSLGVASICRLGSGQGHYAASVEYAIAVCLSS